MKVMITGGMGVIGAMVSDRFVQEGHKPLIIARHVDKTLINDIENNVDIEVCDILDFPRLISILQSYRITHIIHTAALIGALSQQNPPQAVNINVMGTLNILEAARLMKINRVVYASAKGVYGNIAGEYAHPTYKPLPEEYPKNPVRIYESAKLMGEHMGQFYQNSFGLEFVALRFSTTFSPGKTVRHGKMALVSQIIEGAYYRNKVKIEKGGDQRDDIIYTKDVAYGVYLASITPELKHSVYNIGTGKGYTLNDVADQVRQIIPEADLDIGSGLHFLGGPIHYYSVYDISRARKDLHFSPQFTLKEAIKDYLGVLDKLRH